MRRDLTYGIIVSFLVHGGVGYVSNWMGHRPAALPPPEPETPILQITPPNPEPDDPDPVDDQQQSQQHVEFAPPEIADVPHLDPTGIVVPIQPPRPDVSIDPDAKILPADQGHWRNAIRVFNLSDLDQPPVPTGQVKPQYPFEMRKNGVSGSVTVDFIVDPSGSVRNAYAAQSTQREFEQAAVAAVSHWHFRPGRRRGKSVNVHMQVPIVFSLNSGE